MLNQPRKISVADRKYERLCHSSCQYQLTRNEVSKERVIESPKMITSHISHRGKSECKTKAHHCHTTLLAHKLNLLRERELFKAFRILRSPPRQTWPHKLIPCHRAMRRQRGHIHQVIRLLKNFTRTRFSPAHHISPSCFFSPCHATRTCTYSSSKRALFLHLLLCLSVLGYKRRRCSLQTNSDTPDMEHTLPSKVRA